MGNNHNLNGSGQVHFTQIKEDLLAEFADELFAIAPDPEPVKPFYVYASNGDYVEIKTFTKVDVGIKGTFYAHRPIKGPGYVISEADTGLKIESGDNMDIALGRARAKIKGFIDRNSPDAFFKLLADSKAKIQISYPQPAITVTVEEESIPEIEFVQQEEEKPTDLSGAVNMSLNFKNQIDVPYISEILGKPEEEIFGMILAENLGYLNPETNFIESSDQYLSGNIRVKLEQAEEAFRGNTRFERNVDALKEIVPEIIPSGLIQYSLGCAWIPCHIFEAFASHMFKIRVLVKYVVSAGKFDVSLKSGHKTIQITSTYAAGGKNGLEILTATMNNQQISVSETDISGGTKRQVKNIDKTAAAQSMQEQMQEEFQAFIRTSKEYQDDTEVIYNELFNSHVHRDFRVPKIEHYPGASKHIFPRDHQKKAILRGLYESTLFAHAVGSGKTLLIITTAMEMKRLGIANKPLIVVQNKTRGQFITSFMELYPNANIYAPMEGELTNVGRADMLHKILENDWDAIILPQSQFDMIPDDLDRQRRIIEEQIQEANEILWQINKKTAPFEYAHAKRALKSLEKELDEVKISEEKRKSVGQQASTLFGTTKMLNFEDLEVDALLIDEFHRYKRLGFSTAMQNIKGIDTAKSRRSQSVLLKMRWVQQNNKGKNTLVYTGTPISNTMAEAWTMIRYVRPDILEELGIVHFDQFAKTFGQVVPSLEQTGGGTFKIQNRFAKFQNLPEFITAFRACTDVVLKEDIREFIESSTLPKLRTGQIQQVIVKQSPELKAQIQEFRKTLEWYEKLEGQEKREHNYIPLVIFTRAKQASVDLRLLNPLNRDTSMSKVNQVIRRAFQTYTETGLVQMIFCDLYQSPEPKSAFLDEDETIPNPAYGIPRFNLFNDIKSKLISMGVKPEEIAILTEPKYDKIEKAEKLFEDANCARVKFLLGTTERMGVGVNAQKRLFALHHIDAPLRPMDFEQRNGRIERQGNLNKEIDIIAYGTEKTLDSAAFQRLATKQRFINQIMKGEGVDRVMEDAADESQMTFDEMMAQLSDSPYAMQKLLVDNRLKSERMKRDNHMAKLVQTQRQLNWQEDDYNKLILDYEEHKRVSEVVIRQFTHDVIIHQIQIGSEIVTEKFGSAVDQYVDMLIQNYENSATQHAQGFMLVNDVKVILHIKNAQTYSPVTKMLVDYPSLSYTCPEIGIHENRHGDGVNVDSNSGHGLMHSLKWKIENAVERPTISKRKLDSFEVTIAELRRNMDSQFDETRLHELEAEIEELKAKMLEEKNKAVEEEEVSETN